MAIRVTHAGPLSLGRALSIVRSGSVGGGRCDTDFQLLIQRRRIHVLQLSSCLNVSKSEAALQPNGRRNFKMFSYFEIQDMM